MKNKKLIFLGLALILPVLVFVFLKIFGKNEFRVPPLHQEEPVMAPADCPATYPAPYAVADSIVSSLGLNIGDSLFVYYFNEPDAAAMRRVMTEFPMAPVSIVAPVDLPATLDPAFFRKCVLLMIPEASVALVDHRRRIRGYYDGSDRDEVDRLILEMKIILKQY